jgi:hypothetical protein
MYGNSFRFIFFLFLSHPTLPRKIAWHFADILLLFTLPLQRVTVEYLHYDKRTEITNGHENIVHRTNNNKLLQLWTYGKNAEHLKFTGHRLEDDNKKHSGYKEFIMD